MQSEDEVRGAWIVNAATRARRWLPFVAFVLGAMLGSLGVECKAQSVIGVNLATAHASGGYRSDTPGVYLRGESGLTGGILRNSQGRMGAHIGQTWSTSILGAPVDLQAGAIIGYTRAPVLPLATASVLLAEHHRLIWIPGPRGGAINFAMEWK